MTPTGLIGMVHMPPLPGDPLYGGAGGFDAVVDAARRDCDALLTGGIEQMIIENFGSAPFTPGRVEPHVVACIGRVAELCRREGATVGVNCLRNDACSAIGIAAACGADFVRVNVLTGASLTDQGVIAGEAHSVLRYRQRLSAEHVAIFADVLVKHASPLVDTAPALVARDTVERGLADALIVTGDATGDPTSDAVLEDVARAETGVPLFVGSGVTPGTVDAVADRVDGLIVGTYLKVDADVRAPVDPARVREVVDAWQEAKTRA